MEFEGFQKKGSAEKSSNTFMISANGFLFIISKKIISNHIIITN